MATTIRVAINGYGVIGARVADAVRAQPDMEVVGIADVAGDYRVQTAAVLGYPVYAAAPDRRAAMERGGVRTIGTLDDLLRIADVIVDCTPAGVGATNMARYREAGVKAIVQGGEKHALTGHSFVAQLNFASARGLQATRVVSCNTTSMLRTLGALREAKLLRKARGVLIRRATDPWESDHSGVMNTVVPEKTIPSHQGPDAQTVLPDLDVVTIAAKGAHTLGHNHYWVVELSRLSSRDEVLAAFAAARRIAFVRVRDGIVALNSTVELMKDLGRPRGDMWEVAVWEDVLTVQGSEAYYTYQVDNSAIVIPENVDAIRALTGAARDAEESMGITDSTLGMRQDFLRSQALARPSAAFVAAAV